MGSKQALSAIGISLAHTNQAGEWEAWTGGGCGRGQLMLHVKRELLSSSRQWRTWEWKPNVIKKKNRIFFPREAAMKFVKFPDLNVSN